MRPRAENKKVTRHRRSGTRMTLPLPRVGGFRQISGVVGLRLHPGDDWALSYSRRPPHVETGGMRKILLALSVSAACLAGVAQADDHLPANPFGLFYDGSFKNIDDYMQPGA